MATRLEQIVKRAKELKKTAPASTKWTDLIKKASKQVTPVRAKASNKAKAVRNLGLSGVKKKRSTKAGSHKDTRSHNVNIRVVSGTKKFEKKFYSEGYGLEAQLISNYYLLNRRNGGGFVTILNSLQRISKPETDILNDIVEQTGRRASGKTEELLREWLVKLQKTLKPVTKKAVKKAPVKKAPVKKTRSQESEAIREKVRKDGFTMPHGYAVKKAVRETSIGSLSIDQLKRNTEAIERFNSKIIPSLQLQYKYAPASLKAYHKKKLSEAKKYVATLKKQNTSLKRHIK